MRNKKTVIMAVAMATTIALSGCATPTSQPEVSTTESSSSSEMAEEVATPEVSAEPEVVEEKEEPTLFLSYDVTTYSNFNNENITVHKYNDEGKEVYTRKIEAATDNITITEYTDNGTIAKTTTYDNGKLSGFVNYTYDDKGRVATETYYTILDNGEEREDYTSTLTYDDVHELPIQEVQTSITGTDTITRTFDSLDDKSLYVEVLSGDNMEASATTYKRLSDNQPVYYQTDGMETYTDYDEHGNVSGTHGTYFAGNYEEVIENSYDENGNLVSAKSIFDGKENYTKTYTYGTLADSSYNGEGTIKFSESTDIPVTEDATR